MTKYGPLDNYVPVHRKESGLSYKDMSVLLGLGGHSAVAHYEGDSVPKDLERAIAFELIFEEPVQAIFVGAAARVRQQIASRASALLEGPIGKTSAANAQKLETLARLARIDKED